MDDELGGSPITHRIRMYGIYANICGILMVNVTTKMAYIRILWVWIEPDLSGVQCNSSGYEWNKWEIPLGYQ